MRTWYTASPVFVAGEEGIWTDIEGSAEAVSAYEVDVNKLGLAVDTKAGTPVTSPTAKAGVRFLSGFTGYASGGW